MTALRRAACILLAAASLLALPATAASYSTDQSDLWWADPPGSENGWGFQLVQRNSTIFATMFVYAPTGAPTWYVATMAPTPPGSFIWSGDLYTTTGPWFGAVPYNPLLFTFRKVGTMTWTPATVTTGTLSYTVDGVSVIKSVTRQTLVNENYSGHFGGGIHETDTGCANPAYNGTIEDIGVLNIVQNGMAITMTSLPITGGSCAYSGTLAQFGQMGDVVGIFSCSSGSYGSFHIFEFQVTPYSVIGRFTASATVPAGCQATGWFGGLRVTTF
jgi:hypothetical protein